jgi:hypothetical protein
MSSNHGFASAEHSGKEDKIKAEPSCGSACEANEIFRPVNFIPAEAYELIRTWELAHQQEHEPIQAMDFIDTDSLSGSQSSESVLQPILLMPEFEAPPKRFYLTFWKSRAKRLLQRERQRASSRAAMPISVDPDDGLQPSA